MLILLGIIVCDTFAFGSLVVGAPAAAAALGAPATAGVLLSLGSLGAVVSGLIYGSRKRTGAPAPQLAILHLASAVLLTLAGQVTLLILFALLIFAAGLVGGPRDTLHQVVLGEAAPLQYRTEAFAWLGTLMWAGYAGVAERGSRNLEGPALRFVGEAESEPADDRRRAARTGMAFDRKPGSTPGHCAMPRNSRPGFDSRPVHSTRRREEDSCR